jgi:hypothetical protein
MIVTEPLLVDIFPDFINTHDSRIYSNTRSLISLTLGSGLKAVISKSQKDVEGEIFLVYYFLKFSDRDPIVNPLLIDSES